MKKLILALSVLALAACSTTSPDVISRNEAQRLSTVTDATVLSVRSVTVDGTQSGVGSAAGAVIGGVAGSSRGNSRESIALGVLGAVVGGVIGNTVERATTKEDALEILVQLKSGERRSVVQAKGDENLQAGDAVILVSTGGKVRVTKAPAIQQPRS
ncbi:MAG: glycine zipper 2TM domain-containing protein [Rubrivivax sp.]|jgi:outer membrane lipoprotein SlyB|nr:glycine zipper 2TM domain-containing protein [Rubrivivax sp.]